MSSCAGVVHTWMLVQVVTRASLVCSLVKRLYGAGVLTSVLLVRSDAHIESTAHVCGCRYADDENDMVLDPHLDKHLAHWGINMMQVSGGEGVQAWYLESGT